MLRGLHAAAFPSRPTWNAQWLQRRHVRRSGRSIDALPEGRPHPCTADRERCPQAAATGACARRSARRVLFPSPIGGHNPGKCGDALLQCHSVGFAHQGQDLVGARRRQARPAGTGPAPPGDGVLSQPPIAGQDLAGDQALRLPPRCGTADLHLVRGMCAESSAASRAKPASSSRNSSRHSSRERPCSRP